MIFLICPFGFFNFGGNFGNGFVNANRNENDRGNMNRNRGMQNPDSDTPNTNEAPLLHPMTSTLPIMLLTLSFDGISLLFLPFMLASILAPGTRFDAFNLLNGLAAHKQLWAILGVLLILFTFITVTDSENQYSYGYSNPYSRPSNPNRGNPSSRADARAGDSAIDHEFGSSDLIFPIMMVILFYMLPVYWSRIHSFLSTSRFIPQSYRSQFSTWAASYGLTPETHPVGTVPTSKAALANLKDVTLEERHLFAEGAPYITCPVCLENMVLGDTVKILPCKHYFHPYCLLPWLKKRCTCPSCRYELPTDDAVYEESRNVYRNRHTHANRHDLTRNPSTSASQEHLTSRDTLMQLNVARLKEIAREQNIDVSYILEKSELVDRLLNHSL
mmetsp:Transcript_15994/g.19844  ORF Transcript_15994/g.19844 Transcript_15994/m.19844 type:complete len:387 (+) Transcript_15994:168-1328(+)